MTKRQQTIVGVSLVVLAGITGAYRAQWRLEGQTQCPHCAAIISYDVEIENGTQMLTCKQCQKAFAAEVKNNRFTGTNRRPQNGIK